MKLYLITQNEVDGYDTFDAAVVCAPDEATARLVHPNTEKVEDPTKWASVDGWGHWCSHPSKVTAEYIGEAADTVKPGVVCSSFHAG